eukprot:TRINITY_DN55224_c0_g1_i1.p1 TRINITY_DN55224_c0_g1~~TRINITY_DN55224_c0_g1_i1.p1  ORF type:complete len:681 (-),score=48.37 TRINITY_DN55224_c0_g1_i1:517-2559(-)
MPGLKCTYLESDFHRPSLAGNRKISNEKTKPLLKSLKAHVAEVEPRKIGVLSTSLSPKEKQELREALPADHDIQFFVQTKNKLLPDDVGRFPTYVIERFPNIKLNLESEMLRRTEQIAKNTARKRNTHEHKQALSNMVSKEIAAFESRKAATDALKEQATPKRYSKWTKSNDGASLLELLPSGSKAVLFAPSPPSSASRGHKITALLNSSVVLSKNDKKEKDDTAVDAISVISSQGNDSSSSSVWSDESDNEDWDSDEFNEECMHEGMLARWQQRANGKGMPTKTGTWEEEHIILQQLLAFQRLREFCVDYGFTAELAKEIYETLKDAHIDEKAPYGGYGHIWAQTFCNALADIPFPTPPLTPQSNSRPTTAAHASTLNSVHNRKPSAPSQPRPTQSHRPSGYTLPAHFFSHVPSPPSTAESSSTRPRKRRMSKALRHQRRLSSMGLPTTPIKSKWELLFRIFDAEQWGYSTVQNVLVGINWVAKKQSPLYLVIGCLSPVCTTLSSVYTSEYQALITHLKNDTESYASKHLTPDWSDDLLPELDTGSKSAKSTTVSMTGVGGRRPVILQKGRLVQLTPYNPRCASAERRKKLKAQMEEERKFLDTLITELSGIIGFFTNCVKVEFMQFLKAVTTSEFLRRVLRPPLAAAYKLRKRTTAQAVRGKSFHIKRRIAHHQQGNK